MKLMDYFITGLKLIGLGIVAFIIHFIITTALSGIALIAGRGQLFLIMISIPFIIMIDGYLAYKMFKWK